MSASLLHRFFPFLAVLGSVTALGIGTSWAKHWLFPVVGGMNLMFYMSLRTLPFGLAVAIEFSGPLAVAIWSSRRAVDFVWVALAMAGLGMLLPLGLNGSTLDTVGVLYALGAAVFWALYIVFGKRAGHLHAGHTVSLGLLVAALVVVPVGVAHAGAALLSPTVLLIGLAGVAVAGAIPVSLGRVAVERRRGVLQSADITGQPRAQRKWLTK